MKQDREEENEDEETRSIKYRMQAMNDKLEHVIAEIIAIEKVIQQKNAYIRHLEKMLDERLRVV